MKFRLLLLSLFFLLSSSLWAQWSSQMIPLEDPVYEQIDSLLLESGVAQGDTLRPWSVQQAGFLLSKVRENALSRGSRDLYTRLMESYPGEPAEAGKIYFHSEIKATGEVHSRIPLGDWGDTPEDYPWIYDSQERPPWLEIPLNLVLTPHLYMESTFNFEQDPRVDVRKENYLTTLPSGPYDINLQFPHRAFINLGFDNWDLTLGRLQPDWGLGQEGNLLVSDSTDWLEGLRFKIWFDRFSYTYMISSLEPRYPEGTGSHREFDGSKYALYHSFHFSPIKGLHLSLTEALILGGESFQLSLGHLNPMMLWHNWFPGTEGNSYHMIEADYSWQRMRLYGQAALDQYQSSSEKEYFDADSEPNAFGYMLGLERLAFSEEGRFRYGLEGILTMPYLYTHEDYWTRPSTYQFYSSDIGYFIEYPLGFALGPDVIQGALLFEYREDQNWSVNWSGIFRLRGENRIYTLFPETAPDNSTPTGRTEVSLISNLQLEKEWNPHWSSGAFLIFAYRDNPAGSPLDEFIGNRSGSTADLEVGGYLCYQL